MSTKNRSSHHLTRRAMLAVPWMAAPALAGTRIDKGRISAITDEIAKSPAEAIAFAQKYGLKWLELRKVPGGRPEYFDLPAGELKEAAKQFRDGGVGISFLNTSMLKYALPGAEPVDPRRRNAARFEHRQDELKRSIEAAHILGTNKVRIFTFYRAPHWDKVRPRVAEVVNELAEIAAREKIHLLIENEGACNVATAAELVELLKDIPSKWVGINWDPLNAAHKQEIAFPDGYERMPSQRIGNVQIKGKSILPGPEWMDWTAIFRRLEKDGYNGQAGLETHIFGEIQVQKSHESIQEILRLVNA